MTVPVDFEETISPTIAIAEAIGTAVESDPTDLEPLAESIDPVGLDVLLSKNRGSPITVQFQYNGQTVTVDSAGHVTVSFDTDEHESS